ncbi:hypothetical protein T4E_6076 [Trichinella pseudospiralis]|uniref:Uncharacterized protein n=1 Tax=Trichinella pseudospiralis TaxID=6337 RepID=A0A0V0XWS6_TRIPS|nr:hypothetical protein T4E_6076 [Trichinella pseudospiralis]
MTIAVSLIDCKYECLGDRFETFVLKSKIEFRTAKIRCHKLVTKKYYRLSKAGSLMISFRSLPQAHIIVWDLGIVLELHQSSQNASSYNRNRNTILSTDHRTVGYVPAVDI